MFHCRRAGKERPDNRPPVGKGRRLAKIDGVVFQRFPANLQQVALGAFNALEDMIALKPLGMGNHGAKTALDGFVKSGLLARVDANVGKFKNHENSSEWVSAKASL